MSDPSLMCMARLIQEDVGQRGLRADPNDNLITSTEGDFEVVCRHLAQTSQPRVGIVTGFFIPQAAPPAGETDGPLGAVFLARAWVPLGFEVTIAAEGFCESALRAGLQACGLADKVNIVVLPANKAPTASNAYSYREHFRSQTSELTHLIALERVGPSHTEASVKYQSADADTVAAFLQEVPRCEHNRCHTMRGLDITDQMSPAHWLFEEPRTYATIGIGDGGNEIGMGKVRWTTIRRNIPRGGLVACRIKTDGSIVAGISNWGAYGLAAGVLKLLGKNADSELWSPYKEAAILREMVTKGPLVDGVLGKPAVSVDGLDFDRYSAILPELAELLEE